MVGKTGFEPATSWSQTKRSTKLSYFPTYKKMVRQIGLEPTAFWSVAKRSIQLSYWRIMAVSTGLEPAISSVTDWHVNHYTTRPKMVRVTGIEPALRGTRS